MAFLEGLRLGAVRAVDEAIDSIHFVRELFLAPNVRRFVIESDPGHNNGLILSKAEAARTAALLGQAYVCEMRPVIKQLESRHRRGMEAFVLADAGQAALHELKHALGDAQLRTRGGKMSLITCDGLAAYMGYRTMGQRSLEERIAIEAAPHNPGAIDLWRVEQNVRRLPHIYRPLSDE